MSGSDVMAMVDVVLRFFVDGPAGIAHLGDGVMACQGCLDVISARSLAASSAIA